MESTTVTIRNCAIAAGCARHDTGYRADSLRCRSTPGRLPSRSRPLADVPRAGPTLPARGAAGPSLGKHCRPVVLPTCRAAGQLPAGCPTLPAGHSGSVAGPVVLPVKIGPTLPAGCRRAAGQDRLPTCRAPAPRSRPVVLPTCRVADVPRCRSTPGRLPHAPRRSLGNVAAPVVLPTCRVAGPAGCVGRDDRLPCNVAARPYQWCRL